MRIASYCNTRNISWLFEKIQERPMKAMAITLCALPAIEMSIRLTGNLYQIFYKKNKEEEGYIMAGNILGTAFLAAGIFNLFPGGRQVGVITYLFYAIFIFEKHSYAPFLSGKIIAPIFWNTPSFLRSHGVKIVMIFAASVYIYRAVTLTNTSSILSRVWENVKF
jgi:hypothetical protein